MAKLRFDITANDGVSRVLGGIESRYKELEKTASKVGTVVKKSVSDSVESIREIGGSLNAQIDYIKGLRSQLAQLNTRKAAILGKGSSASSSEHAELLKINRAHREITKAIKEEEDALKDLGASFTSSMKGCNKELNRFEKELDKASKQGGISKLEKAFESIGKKAAAMFTLKKAADFAKKVAQVRGEMQSLEAAFTTMLGSKEASDALLQQSIEFAATTPFDLQQVAKGAKQLLAFGTAQENVIDDMRMLGDVAAGLTIPIGDLIYLYGTLRAQGRVMTIDIRQFAMRGIPIYDELAKVLGVAKDRIQEMVSSGAVTFEHVEQAFKNMTSEGGKFAGLTQGIAGTIQGRISNLGDSIYQMYNEIGQKTEGIINTVLKVASVAVENYEKIGKAIGAIITAYGTYRAALMLNAAVSKAVTAKAIANNAAEAASVNGVTAAYLAKMKLLRGMAFLKSGGGILAIVAGLSAAMFKYNKSVADGTIAQGNFEWRTNKQNKALEKNKKRVDELTRALSSLERGSENYIETLDKIIKEYPELLDKYDLEKLVLMDIKDLKNEIAAIDAQRNYEDDKERLEEIERSIPRLKKSIVSAERSGAGQAVPSMKNELKVLEQERALLEPRVLAYEMNGPALPAGFKRKTGSGEEAKNKEYWEKKKKEAESALEAISSDQLHSAEAKKLLAELAEIDKELEKYDFDKKETKDNTRDKILSAEEKLQKAVREQKDAARLYNKKGDERELEEMKIAHEKKVDELKREKKELEELYKKTGKPLTDNQKANLSMYDALIAGEDQRYNVEASDYPKKKYAELRDKYKGFETLLDELKKEYHNEIALVELYESDINKQGEILGKIDEVYRERLQELYRTIKEEGGKINEEFTNTLGGPMLSAEYWLNSLKDKSLSDLTLELANLQTMLDVGVLTGILSEEEAASLLAMIGALKDAIEQNSDKVKKNETSWTDLQSTLKGVGSEFEKVGDKIGGVVGDAISFVGKLAVNVAELGNAFSVLESETATKQEKLAADLSIASIAFAVVAEVISLMRAESERANEVYEKAIEYERTLRELQRERERSQFSNAFGEDAYSKFLYDMNNIEEKAYKSIDLIKAYALSASSYILGGFPDALEEAAALLYNKMWEKKDATFTVDMRTQFSKFMGFNNNLIQKEWADFFDENGELRGEELKEWYETYKEYLNAADAAFLQGVIENWEEYQKSLEGVKDFISGLMDDISGSIASDMVDQFLETGNAILDMTDYMDDFSKSIAKSIVQSMLLRKVFTKERQDEIADLIASGKTDEAIQQYNKLLEDANALAPQIQAYLEGIGLNSGSKMPEPSAGGFQTMSQETGTELNGRFTAVQISSEATRAAVEQISNQFDSFFVVYSNKAIVVDDIRNIQAQSLLELMAINENTRKVIAPIKEMNTTMTEMNNKIKTL